MSFLTFPKCDCMKKFIVSVFLGSMFLTVGCASSENGLDGKPVEPVHVGSVKYGGFEGGLPLGEVLVGISLDVQNPEKVADGIAKRYGGEVVGSIPEVREYQLRFPVDEEEKMSFLKDEIGRNTAVSFVF